MMSYSLHWSYLAPVWPTKDKGFSSSGQLLCYRTPTRCHIIEGLAKPLDAVARTPACRLLELGYGSRVAAD